MVTPNENSYLKLPVFKGEFQIIICVGLLISDYRQGQKA